MTTATRTFTLTVQAPVSSNAPSWLSSVPYLAWTPVASGSSRTDLAEWQRGTRLDATVAPPPYQGFQSQDDIVQTGNGAAVDQANLEMLIVAPGGHSGRQENDSFRLVLNTATPYWQRLTDSTPFADLDWHIDSNATTEPEQNQYWSLNQRVSPGNGVPASGSRVWNTPTGGTVDRRYYPACAGDGAVSTGSTVRQQWYPWTITTLNDIPDRPRTMHAGYTPWYSNGKVWFPLQNSVDVGTGFSLNIIMSFDVTTVRAGTIPRPFVAGRDVWDYYRAVTEMSTTGNIFGACAMDYSTGRVWYHGANLTRFYSVNTLTNPGTYSTYVDPSSANNQFTNAASAICPVAGRRLWVVLASGSNHANTLRVYDLDLIEAGTVNTTSCERLIEVPAIASKVWNFNHTDIGEEKKGWGMVWHEPDLSFLLYSCDDMSRAGTRSGYLRRIKPPLNANGTYNRGGTWACDEIAIDGLPDFVTGPGTTSVSGGSLTRFNIFHDVGNGESLLVSQGNYDTPCYVCRLPKSTLTGA